MSRNLIALAVWCMLLTGCATPAKNTGKLNVVASTSMIGDAVKQIGGDKVDVVTIMGPGVDPHTYQPSPGDTAKLQNADLVLYHGLHLESKKMEEALLGTKKAGAVTDKLDPDKDLRPAPAGMEANRDPHVWFDMKLWAKVVDRAAQLLGEKDPKNKELYTKNAEAYIKELHKTDDDLRAKVAEIPEERRVLITAHDAFYYFGHAYGLQVKALQGISTAEEANPADVEDLAKFIAQNKIKAIFVESTVSVRNVEAVKAAVKAKGFDVKIGGELYSDALGDGEAGTLIGMVRHNAKTIVNALK